VNNSLTGEKIVFTPSGAVCVTVWIMDTFSPTTFSTVIHSGREGAARQPGRVISSVCADSQTARQPGWTVGVCLDTGVWSVLESLRKELLSNENSNFYPFL